MLSPSPSPFRSIDLLTKRREALFILGEAYYAKCGDINVGLEELTNKVGMQSGMFGGHGEADPTADGKGSSDEAGAKGEGNQITNNQMFPLMLHSSDL